MSSFHRRTHRRYPSRSFTYLHSGFAGLGFILPGICLRAVLALLALCSVTALCSVLASAASADEPATLKLKRFSRVEIHMGVDFQVVLYAEDAERAETAMDAAMARIAELDKLLSDYNAESELSLLSATSHANAAAAATAAFPAVKVSDDLWQVLSYAQEISAASDGAFDVTVGPLTKLWRRARRQNALPEQELFAKAKAAVGWRFLKLSEEAQTAQLLKADMRLDLGGIAKGYAADEALAAIEKHGISRALVRGSGDIAAGDPPPGESGWLVGIAPLNPDDLPQRFVRLANRAISTSGDSRQHLVIEGRRYSHIIDPKTGLGISGRSSVSVISPRGIAADALASAVSVLGPKRGLKLVESLDGNELLMIYMTEDDALRAAESAGFKQFESRPPEYDAP